MSPGGGELQQVPILNTEQRTQPSALSELKIPALHTALFLFLLARRAGTLEQVSTPARCEQGPGKSQAHLGRKWTFELDRGAFCPGSGAPGCTLEAQALEQGSARRADPLIGLETTQVER